MAIGTVVWGTISAGDGSGFTLTPGYPASPAAGDLLVVFCYTRGNDSTSFTLPSGWTSLLYTATANGSYRIFYKEATGSESGTLSVTTTTGANVSVMARMCKIPGAETSSSLLDSTIVEETEAAASPFSNAGCTSSSANSLIVLFLGKTDGGAATTNDFSSFSGGSLTWASVADGTTAGFDAALGIGTAVKSAAGATGTLSASCTLAATGISVSFAIKEKAGGSSYSNTQTETATASDALAATRVLRGQTQAETATATDAYVSSLAGAGTTYNDGQAETATASDALASTRVVRGQAQTETATATDVLAATRILLGQGQAETATATDVLAAARVLLGQGQVETATATDAYASDVATGTTYNDGQAETATATEAWGVSQAYAATLAEAVTATDAYVSAITHPVTTYNDGQAETVTATDAYAASVRSAIQQRFFVWDGSAWV